MSALVQRSDEWLDLRRHYIGASDAPVIMGVGYRTPYQLWRDKLGLEQPQPCNAAMQRGIDLEPKARAEFESMTGIQVEPTCLFRTDQAFPMMASLDGISRDKKAIVEIKCPGSHDHALALSGQIPDKYYPQLQHQIFVANVDFTYYFSFDGKHGVLLEVDRDNAYLDSLLDKESAFWHYVENLDEPPLEARDYDERTDALWLEAAERYNALTAQIEALTSQRDHAKDLLVNLAKSPNSRGGGITLRKIARKGNVDYSAIPQLQGVNLDGYRKAPTDYWRIVS